MIPGIYLWIRWSLVEAVAVCEQVSGAAAMHRSMTLTQGRMGKVLWLGLVLGGLLLIELVVIVVPSILIPILDHWIVDAATALLCDLLGAFGTLCVLCTYLAFSEAGNESRRSREPDPIPLRRSEQAEE